MAILKLKPGVSLKGVKPEIVFGIISALSIASSLGLGELVITACKDGQHKVGSLHYKCLAVDIRTNTMSTPVRLSFISKLKEALDTEFDIVDENVGTPGQHVHLEYDPGNANHS